MLFRSDLVGAVEGAFVGADVGVAVGEGVGVLVGAIVGAPNTRRSTWMVPGSRAVRPVGSYALKRNDVCHTSSLAKPWNNTRLLLNTDGNTVMIPVLLLVTGFTRYSMPVSGGAISVKVKLLV